MKNKIHNTAYCFNCKKYYDKNLTDGQGLICCPNCKEAYRFNVMQLKYNNYDKYCIEIQEDLIINFKDEKDFDRLVNIMKNLIKNAKSKIGVKD